MRHTNMKATDKIGKQSGFFSIGIGLALFAIFGAIGTGISVATDTQKQDYEKLVLQAELTTNQNFMGELGGNGSFTNK